MKVTLQKAFAGKPGDRVDLGHGITGTVKVMEPNPLIEGKLRDLSMESVVTVERS